MSAPVPGDFMAQIRRMIREEIGNYAKSGATQSSSISGGTMVISNGGALAVLNEAGGFSAYMGGAEPPLPDGSFQPVTILYREDGTVALAVYDPTPDPTTGYHQFVGIFDRQQNLVLADATDAAQGLLRPWSVFGFAPTRFADFAVSTTSSSFETLWDARIPKQRPGMMAWVRASMDTAGTAGEVRVLVNGTQLGTTSTIGFAVATNFYGPAAVSGNHLGDLIIEVQGRRTSASGALRVQPITGYERE